MDNYNMLYNIIGNFNQNDLIVMYVCFDFDFVENFIDLCPNIKILQINDLIGLLLDTNKYQVNNEMLYFHIKIMLFCNYIFGLNGAWSCA